MGNSFSQGAQSAASLGEAFVAGALIAGSVAVTAAKLTESVTPLDSQGVTFVPDFVLYSNALNDGDGESYTVTTSATVVTFTRATSAAADTIFYIIGNLE